jgi:hypothetical protein
MILIVVVAVVAAVMFLGFGRTVRIVPQARAYVVERLGSGQAEAISTVFEAIHRGRPDPQLLAYQYLQTLPKLANGGGNHTWLIPSELTRALDAFASGFGDRRTGQTSTPSPAASGEAVGPPQVPPVVIPARPAADGAASPRSARREQAAGTQHHEHDDAWRTG